MEVLKDDEIDEVIDFARKHHLGFAQVPISFVKIMFEKYRKTTLVYKSNGQMKGFAIYQEWPEFLNFLAIVGDKGLFRIMWRVLHNKELLPTKPFGFFDELRMEGRFLCHLQE